MKAKEKLAVFFEEDFDFFVEKLFAEYRLIELSGDIDNNSSAFILTSEQFKKIIGIKPVSLEAHKRYRCGHDYDCCGCLCYQGIDIKKHNNGYITIFVTNRFNY